MRTGRQVRFTRCTFGYNLALSAARIFTALFKYLTLFLTLCEFIWASGTNVDSLILSSLQTNHILETNINGANFLSSITTMELHRARVHPAGRIYRPASVRH